MSYRLKTQPDEPNDKLDVGFNGMLAGVKAQEVANETGLVVVMERQEHRPEAKGADRYVWVPDTVYFPGSSGTPSKRVQP